MVDNGNESPTRRGNTYLVCTSGSMEDRNGTPMASPSSKDGSPQKTLMTESEINSLVHEALIRARKGKKSFSPRTKGVQNLNTKSADSATPSKKKISVPSLDAASRDSMESSYASSKSQLPAHLRIALSNLSAPRKDFQVVVAEQLSMQSSMGAPSISDIESENSSDEVLKKVEEEIANARMAAKEATRRLAGVSSNFMADAKHSNPKIPKNLGLPNNSNQQSNLDEQLGQMMAVETNDSSSTDADRNFGSALELIGDEFDEIVQGPSGYSSEFAEEKKEEDHDRMDERNDMAAQNRNNSQYNGGAIKAVVNVNNTSIDDTYIYELEAVLSDEREMDRLAMQAQETKHEDQDQPEENLAIQENFSIDQDCEETESHEGDEHTDEMSSSPDLSISISVSISKEEDGSSDSSESEKASLISTETDNPTVAIHPVDIEDKVFDERDTSLTLNESKDDSKIQQRENFTAMKNENPTVDDDQKTELANNTTNPPLSPLTDRLMSVFLRRRPTTPKTKNAHIDTASKKTNVTFKQRYPIPQKLKKFREPSEILRDNQVEQETHNLWLSMPKPELKELLDAVTGTSIQRRSNACGALKVMSTQKKNQLTLVRTKGFLDAIVFAINDDYSIEDEELGIAARTRAVNVVLNVSARKDNRYHVLLHTGLRKSLVKCLMEDDAEAKELACAAFAIMAKSQYCREPIGKTENLIDALANLLKNDVKPVIDDTTLVEATTNYSGDDERSSRLGSNTFSSSALSSRSSSTRSSYGVDSIETEKTEGEDSEVRRRTRMNACAVLMHLSKECSITQQLCESNTLLSSLVSCCREVENPIHTKCLEILANLTRFPQNNARLVEFPDFVDALLINGTHEDDFDRLWSMRIFQNLSSEPSAKTMLATSSVLELLSTNMMGKQYEEQLAATSAMYNISTEPGAVVPLTNTKNVVATLVHVAHSPSSMMEVRTIACDALATIGLWLQTLSSAGTVPEGVKPVALPSHITSGWQRWDE